MYRCTSQSEKEVLAQEKTQPNLNGCVLATCPISPSSTMSRAGSPSPPPVVTKMHSNFGEEGYFNFGVSVPTFYFQPARRAAVARRGAVPERRILNGACRTLPLSRINC
eukprot:scaffold4485_cov135-Isochrysis_galbana.AAC.4